MKIVLFTVLLAVFYTPLTTGPSQEKEIFSFKECMNEQYSYVIETNLSVSEFYENFCERLKNKYNWHKISEVLNGDKAYIAVFTFNEINNSHWICELKIEKAKYLLNTISVEMLLKPYTGI